MSGELSNIYSNVGFALNLHAEAMARLQEQVSTGSRINRASDDPSNAYRVLGLESQGRSLDNYTDNLAEMSGRLEITSAVIQNMVSELGETRTRIAQVVSGIYDEAARQRTAEGINDILEQILSLANTEHSNSYLFGGSDTATAPYTAQRTSGQITSVTYQGSTEQRNIEVAPGVQSSAFYVGDNVFRADSRSAPTFAGGNTGAAAGTGTSNVSGFAWLTVTDTNTDGIFELSIDDGASTVNADGTANQAITHSVTGEVLYIDSTAITSTGVELVSVPGTHNIFNVLITIRDVLENDRGLTDAQIQAVNGSLISALEEVNNMLLQAEVSIGSKIGFLEDLKYTLGEIKFNTESETTRLEEADIAQVAIDLSRREVLYQMSLAIAAKMMSLSLLDFIA
jgi:flagellar hook-associated protein 3 FlgL